MSSSPSSYGVHPGDRSADFCWTARPQGPGVTRVSLGGEFDILNAASLGDALADAARGSAAVILDLSQLTFMDSSGLHAILTARNRLSEAGCRLVILRGSHRVQRLFELSGVDGVLEFVSAREGDELAAIPSS